MEKQEQKIDKLEQDAKKAVQKAGEKDNVLREWELKENTASLKYEQAVSVKEEKEAEYHSIVKDGRELEEQKNILEDTLSRIVERLEESQKANETAKNELEQASERIEQVREELSACQQRLTELKVDISTDTSQQEFLAENLEKAERLLKERRTEYEALVNEQDQSDCQIGRAHV